MTTVPRSRFVAHMAQLALPNMQSFLRFIQKPDARGAMPCWGALSERFDAEFPSSSMRLEVWRELVELGDRRPQLLFVDLNRERPEVLERVVADAERLPEEVQRVLITSEPARPFVLRSLSKFRPAARQLLDHGAEALERERRLQRRALQKLRQIHFFVPDQLAPEDEQRQQPAKPAQPPAGSARSASSKRPVKTKRPAKAKSAPRSAGGG